MRRLWSCALAACLAGSALADPPVVYSGEAPRPLRGVLAHAGAYLPRGDLGVGALAGVDVVWPLLLGGRLAIVGGFDWARLSSKDAVLTSPPDYPRGSAQLIQVSDVYTVYGGAEFRLLRLGKAEISAGAEIGAAFNHSTFQAYSQSRAEGDQTVAGMVSATARGPLGPLIWSASLSWREARFELGQSGQLGEDWTSGLLVGVGLGARL